ncbi:hypothetical protein SERLA73DRAFT_83686 [Serpula lacrymans var. lacrymans S7.3]|uniref:Nudix hydrolase domain-containing protein n=2 Tax=Serpula lacrymans var. lacrymans TaxID=341189 RepID=F8PKQ0_SERL3|nr:uncharacterized protein SERLADRAFT_457131 [Serpula lacrymans var. lacrymans S7.9]EGO03597.1 hypothetical protein SERLA73DRAFT_83686 [Serpula lacrymans var. lacrymans S7.3]EGO29417.1 hypothetical protein SERLADRAFT_457131 [Serpula lacrymans var. lacrymans S7.9]
MVWSRVSKCWYACAVRSGYYGQPATQARSRSYSHTSLLPLVRASNNLVLSSGSFHDENKTHWIASRKDETLVDKEHVYPLFLSAAPLSCSSSPIGFLRQDLFSALLDDHRVQLRLQGKSPWDIRVRGSSANGDPAGSPWAMAFAPWVNAGGRELRSHHIGRLVDEWREGGMFRDMLRGWSNEAYPIYNPARIESFEDSVAFTVERTSLPLFGFANFGCLLTAYFDSNDTGKRMLWVPRRSKTKRTWPGRLDVTVGGGIAAGDSALSTIVRESSEEASLDASYVRQHIRSAGLLPFPNRSPAGWVLPGVYYLFDLPLPADGSVFPRTNVADGEVESFELMDVQMVLENLMEGMFKPSSALALVDFLVRHGYVTDETDPAYVQLCLQLKKELPWPLPR